MTSDLPRPFKMEGVVRKDDSLQHKAVREAVTNMIIHADYHSTGVLKVIKYEDGFLFSNPGNLKLPVQAMICPLSSRQVKYLKLNVDDACISF